MSKLSSLELGERKDFLDKICNLKKILNFFLPWTITSSFLFVLLLSFSKGDRLD